jgi:glycosyltransferase involved in cell wall biosynthesis
MRVLFLSQWVPYPADNGSKLRILNLLRGLAGQHDVTLLAFSDAPPSSRASRELSSLCSIVRVIRRKTFSPSSARALVGALSPAPRVLVDTYVPAMEHQLRRELSTRRHDLVIASEWPAIAYARTFGDVPAICEDIELGVLESKAARARGGLQQLRYHLPVLKLQLYLRGALRRFAACTVVSEEERSLLRRRVPGYAPIEVIPNCVDLASYASVRPIRQPNTLIFAGSFRYAINHDAMAWFVRDVYPNVLDKIPDVRLTITGDHADRQLPPARNVSLTGLVDDVRPLVASSAVSIAPIRLGAGTRLKIVEAMALGTPVVATPEAAEGLAVRHGEHLLIARTPQAFAEAVTRLLVEPRLRDALAERAFALVQQQYDWAGVMPEFLNLVNRVADAA